MKATTPYAIAVAAAATWHLSPLASAAVAIGMSAAYTLWRIARVFLLYPGPTVIDPDSPPQKVDRFPPL